jgi:hypothetical protein
LEVSLLSNVFANAPLNDVVTAAVLMGVSTLETKRKEDIVLQHVRALTETYTPSTVCTLSWLMDHFRDLDKRANVDSVYHDFRCHLTEITQIE